MCGGQSLGPAGFSSSGAVAMGPRVATGCGRWRGMQAIEYGKLSLRPVGSTSESIAVGSGVAVHSIRRYRMRRDGIGGWTWCFKMFNSVFYDTLTDCEPARALI